MEAKTPSIRPVGHKILVEIKPVEETTESGIVMVYENKRAVEVSQEIGRIVRVGDTAWNAHVIQKEDGKTGPGKPWAQEGDYISFNKFAPAMLTDPVTGIEYALMNDDDVNAVFEVTDEIEWGAFA